MMMKDSARHAELIRQHSRSRQHSHSRQHSLHIHMQLLQTTSNNAQNPYGQPVYAAGNQTAQTKPAKFNNKMLPVYAAAAVLVILLIVFFFRSVVGSGSLTMKGAVKSYGKAIEAQSGKKMLNDL